MATVQFTRHLLRFFPDLATEEIEATDVAGIVAELDVRHPGLGHYLVDEHGALRQHVNIFVGDTMVRDRQALSDEVGASDTIFVMQALSGG